ncbi:MAG: CBS domain-containing protein [Myxococcales bacterium]|nr:CBS domain-containing protein [Myxococcales bacterium]
MRVSNVMSRDLLALPSDAPVSVGLHKAEARDLHHVLVADAGQLKGVMCVCELRERPRDEPLGACVTRPPDVIEPQCTLDQAADRFVQSGVSCFPVCEGPELVGVLTRSDLLRNRVPETKLPASFVCSFCGSTRHVRPLHGDEALAACLDCADRSVGSNDRLYDEGGPG